VGNGTLLMELFPEFITIFTLPYLALLIKFMVDFMNVLVLHAHNSHDLDIRFLPTEFDSHSFCTGLLINP